MLAKHECHVQEGTEAERQENHARTRIPTLLKRAKLGAIYLAYDDRNHVAIRGMMASITVTAARANGEDVDEGRFFYG